MLPKRVGIVLLLGSARSSLWPSQSCGSEAFLVPTPLAFVASPTTAISTSNLNLRAPARPQQLLHTEQARQPNNNSCAPSHSDNRLLQISDQLVRPTSSSLSMGRRTELGASPWKTDSRTVQEWLEFSDRELRKLETVLGPRRPRCNLEKRLELLADGKTDSIVGFLRVDFRMSKAAVRAAAMRFPRLLVLPREAAVTRCDWLVSNLGLNKKQLAKMVSRHPMMFTYGAEESYRPVVEWLKTNLEMDTKQVARLVVKLPQVFGFKLDEHLGDTIRFLEALGLTRQQVRSMAVMHPQIFSYSLEHKMIPMLEWLQQQLGASPEEVIQMVLKYPSLFGCSTTKNLAPKLSFLREILQASIQDIRGAVVACPSLLGYSLDRRIRPRVMFMLERGVDPRFPEHKWLLTVLSEDKFHEWMRDNSGRRR